MNKNESAQKLWTPSNIITIIRILLVPVFVAVLLAPWPEWFGLSEVVDDYWKRILAAGVFILISATDWLDGYLARSRNEITDFGKFMDPLADKILVAAALISLVELGALPTWVVLIILAREFIVSGIRMMAASKGVVIAASMLGKFKTVFQMIAIVLFVIKDSYTESSFMSAVEDPVWDISWIVMIIALGLTVASLCDYLLKARPLFKMDNPKAQGDLSANRTLLSEANTSLVSEASITSLATKIIDLAMNKNVTISTAESLTGGMISSALTSVSGSSSVFLGGIVSYTNPVKHAELDVPQDILDNQGAVSSECVCAMARGARENLNTDIAVAVSGIAGPTGAEPGKPVGTVWLALSTTNGEQALVEHFQGDRNEVRMQTTKRALELILAELR